MNIKEHFGFVWLKQENEDLASMFLQQRQLCPEDRTWVVPKAGLAFRRHLHGVPDKFYLAVSPGQLVLQHAAVLYPPPR